jgi:hypothetical protein
MNNSYFPERQQLAQHEGTLVTAPVCCPCSSPYAPTSPPETTARFTWPGCRPCKVVSCLMMILNHRFLQDWVLSAPLKALADFLYIGTNLITAAAARSEPMNDKATRRQLEVWISVASA